MNPAMNQTLHAARPHTIQTVNNHTVDLANPRPEDIDPDDIAHALSNIGRYGGHLPRFYSVAEHSVYVMQAAMRDPRASKVDPDMLAKCSIMHDSPEAFLGDVVSPLKRLLGAPYTDAEANFEAVISARFNLVETDEIARIVKSADIAVYVAECSQLRGFGRDHFATYTDPTIFDRPWGGVIRALPPVEAKVFFAMEMAKLGMYPMGDLLELGRRVR